MFDEHKAGNPPLQEEESLWVYRVRTNIIVYGSIECYKARLESLHRDSIRTQVGSD